MGTCGRRCRCCCCCGCRRRSRTRNDVLGETDKIVTVAVQVIVMAVVMAVLHGLMIVKGSCVEKVMMIVMVVIGVRLVMQHDMSRWREFLLLVTLTTKSKLSNLN